MSLKNNKSLGQHWLKDRDVLSYIANCADLSTDDTVLEIGPGLGTLTSELLRRSGKVVAVEYDDELAKKLPAQFPGKNLEVINEDILSFDFSKMPTGYKVVANIPYYITGKILQQLMTTKNKPSIVVLLIQKEVAERLYAKPGQMNILAISTQVFAEIKLGEIVKAEMFTPPPKVDSQVIILKMRNSPLLTDVKQSDFFKVVKACFSEKRKKLRSSLSGGLGISKNEAETILKKSNIDPNDRAEKLNINDFIQLTKVICYNSK